MIGVIESDGAGRSHPFREIERSVSVIPVGDNRVADGVQQPSSFAAATHPVITRIFGKNGWIQKVAEEARGGLAGEIGSESSRVAGAALTERRIPVLCLVEPGIESGRQNGNRVTAVLEKQHQFVSGL